MTNNEEELIQILLVPGHWEMIGDITFLKPYMFADKILGEIYRILYDSFESNRAESYATIRNRMFDIEGVSDRDVVARLDALIRITPDPRTHTANAEEIVKEYKRRKVRDIIQSFSPSHSEVEADISELIDALDELQESTAIKSGVSLSEMASKYKGEYPRGKNESGIRIGIEKVDGYLGGIEGGDLCYIGARPSVGKSAFVSQIARNLSSDNLKVGFFSLEMQERNIYERFLSSESKVSMKKIRGREGINAGSGEWERLDEAEKNLGKVENIFIYTGSFTVADIRQITQNDRLQVVIVDYVQLIKPEGRYRGNRVAEVGEISHKLKAIAMDFNIPMILLVQLNRAVELRDDKEPTLADIRESGDIEQDASQVIFLWNRPGVNDTDRSKKGLCIAKNRNGELGSFKMMFKGETMRFTMEDSEASKVTDEERENLIFKKTNDLDYDCEEIPFPS